MCGAMGERGGDAVNHRSYAPQAWRLRELDRDVVPAISGTCIFGDRGISPLYSYF